MTPEQLSEIEARAKTPDCGDNGCRYAKTPRTGMRTNGGCRCVESWRDQIPELVARCRDLEKSLDQWQGSHENEVAKREKAEARVKELEASLEYDRKAAIQWADILKARAHDRNMANARVAVLRNTLERIQLDSGERLVQHLAGSTLATLDPAATALTERLKAAESDNDHLRKVVESMGAVAGELAKRVVTLCPHRWITIDRCSDCGVFVGPQP